MCRRIVGFSWLNMDTVVKKACNNMYLLLAVFNLSGQVSDKMVQEKGRLDNVIIDVVLPVKEKIIHTTSTDIKSQIHTYIHLYIMQLQVQLRHFFNVVVDLFFNLVEQFLFVSEKKISSQKRDGFFVLFSP